MINKEDFFIVETLIYYEAYLNYISEGIVSTKYFSKMTQVLNTSNGEKMAINYKLSNIVVCNDGICLETTFLLSKELPRIVILETPFKVTKEGITFDLKCHTIMFKFSKEPQ